MSDLFNKCPVCGGWLYDICLTSNPPKYVKKCYQCGYSRDRDVANIIAAPSVDSPVIDGVGADVPVTTNENGGKQSRTPYGFHLLPTSAIFDAAKVAAEGAAKYGETFRKRNYTKISTEDHLNHAIQHIYAFLAGDKQDDHLGHAIVRLMFAYDVNEKGVEKDPQSLCIDPPAEISHV